MGERDLIFKHPVVGNVDPSQLNAKFVAPDPKTDDQDHYPTTMESVHTMVAGNSDPSSKKDTPHKPNFMNRAFYIGWLLFWAILLQTFIVDLASVTAQNNGGLFLPSYPIVSGIAAWLGLALCQHVIYSLDPVLQFGELFMGHYIQTIPAMHQRFMLWIICFIFVLAGAVAGAALVLAMDGSQFQGTPIVPAGMMWQAFGIEIIGTVARTWVLWSGYFNPESWANKRKTNVPVMYGLVTIAVTWIAVPYSTGCFNPIRYLATSLISENWDVNGWVFVVSPIIGYLLGGMILYYWTFRTTKQGEAWHMD